MNTWIKQRQGPDESRYILGPEPGNRFIARMDNEATDEEWTLAASAPALLAAMEKLVVCAKALDDGLGKVMIARTSIGELSAESSRVYNAINDAREVIANATRNEKQP